VKNGFFNREIEGFDSVSDLSIKFLFSIILVLYPISLIENFTEGVVADFIFYVRTVLSFGILAVLLVNIARIKIPLAAILLFITVFPQIFLWGYNKPWLDMNLQLVLIIALYNLKNISSLLNVAAYSYLIITSTLFILVVLNVIDSYTGIEDGLIINYMGYKNPNSFSLIIFSSYLFFFYIGKRFLAICTLIFLIVTFFYTNTRSMFYTSILLFFYYLFILLVENGTFSTRFFKNINVLLISLIFSIGLLSSIFPLLIIQFFPEVDFGFLLSGRLDSALEGLQTVTSMNIFLGGKDLAADSMYLNLVVAFGLPFLIVLFYFTVKAINQLSKGGYYYIMIIISFFMIGVIEYIVNPSSIMSLMVFLLIISSTTKVRHIVKKNLLIY
jgi:hypothetical protein